MTLSPDFTALLSEAIGEDGLKAALVGLDCDPAVSVRYNPEKISEEVLRENFSPVGLEEVPLCKQGYFLSERPSFTLDPLLHGGAYYVQDSSAMFVGSMVEDALPRILEEIGPRPVRVLDLCAAPGGKTTHLASVLRKACGDNFILVSNEVMRQRAAVLCQNVSVWGDPCVVVTSEDPSSFSLMKSFFDIVVTDVPCSGEGMFRKDPEALRQWSVENVDMCAARQRRILADMWPCLRPGGILVYSTCTFNRKENDLNVKWVSEELGADIILPSEREGGVLMTDFGYSLVPGFVRGEGQYCALLKKTSGEIGSSFSFDPKVPAGGRGGKRNSPSVQIPSFLGDYLTDQCSFVSRAETFIGIPTRIKAFVEQLSPLHPMMAGVAIGTVKGKDFVPDGDLANSVMFRRGSIPEFEVQKEIALSFLHRDAIRLPDAPKGFLLLTYRGVGIGFVKNIGSRCNNLLPQSRRIRMDLQ